MTVPTRDPAEHARRLQAVRDWMRENDKTTPPGVVRVRKIASPCGDDNAKAVIADIKAELDIDDNESTTPPPRQGGDSDATDPAIPVVPPADDSRDPIATTPVAPPTTGGTNGRRHHRDPIATTVAMDPSRHRDTHRGDSDNDPATPSRQNEGDTLLELSRHNGDTHRDNPSPQVNPVATPIATVGDNLSHQAAPGGDSSLSRPATAPGDTHRDTTTPGDDAPSRQAPATPTTTVATSPAETGADHHDDSIATPSPTYSATAAGDDSRDKPRGRTAWFIAAAVGIGISAYNAWHFFEAEWSAPWYIRAVLCFVLELAIIAGGLEMHAESQKGRRAPRAQAIAWGASAFAVLIAVGAEGGWGLVFGIVGPVLAVVTFHQALGIEIRHATGRQRGAVAAELVERFKTRLGLADDDRDAARRIRDRHAVRAGRLAARPGKLGRIRKARLRRAVIRAQVSTDERSQDLMLAEQATLRGLDNLTKRETHAPWETDRDT